MSFQRQPPPQDPRKPLREGIDKGGLNPEPRVVRPPNPPAQKPPPRQQPAASSSRGSSNGR